MRLFEGTEFDIPPTCERCEKLESMCECPPMVLPVQLIPPEKQSAVVRIEKRKRGKVVTLVTGLSETGNDLPSLLTRLKDMCGSGGTIKDGVIELQGAHLERVTAILKQIGFRVKHSR